MAAMAQAGEDKMSEMCKLAAEATQAMKEGRDADALEMVNRLVAEDSRSPLWWVMRSRVQLKRREVEAALADAEHALELQPGHTEALALRAELLAARGGEGTTAPAAAAAPASTGPSSESLCKLAAQGMQAWKDGKVGKACDIFSTLQSLDGTSPLWPCLLARAHLAQDQTSEALAVMASALAVQPRNVELLVLRGKTRLSTGERSLALADLQHARRIGGLSQAVAKELEEALSELGEAKPSSRSGGAASPKPAASTTASTVAAARAPEARAPDAAELSGREDKGKDKEAAAKRAASLKAAVEAERQSNFLQARQHCEECLALTAGMPEAVLCLARMELANGCGPAAVKLLREKHRAILKLKPHCIEAFSILAGASESQEEWDEAAMDLDSAVKFANQASGTTKPPLDELIGRLARAHWKGGERDQAASIAQRVLDSNPAQREACEVACGLLLDRGDSATALAVMLRCLIGHRNEPSKNSADLVCSVMKRCSAEELAHVLNPNKEDLDFDRRSSMAEVVGYVGLIMKERSEVAEACRLYRMAALWAPSHASLCLNLMHTFSLRRDDLRALAWGVRYFKQLSSVPAAQLVCSWLEGDADSKDTSGAALEPGQFSGTTAFYDTVGVGFVILKLLFLAHPYSTVVYGASTAEHEERPPPWRRRFQELNVETEAAGEKARSLAKECWLKQQEPGTASADELAETEAHAVVLRGICAVLAASRKGRDLHLTPVRNEHAYFSCIEDILKLPPQPLADGPTGPCGRLFAVGDSHVLPVAWRCVDMPTAEGQLSRHTIVPCLVTGAKLWHLQAKSKFYTKYAFWERIAALPPGAPVLLILGEIDCREGVLRAVQKGRHASIEAALTAVVDLYLALLREVRKRLPKSLLFVHPVANVLPETRFMTLHFNRLLAAASSRRALAQADVRLLEFKSVFQGGEPPADTGVRELSKLELLPELQLDGTHMNPSYVDSHLAPALQQSWPH